MSYFGIDKFSFSLYSFPMIICSKCDDVLYFGTMPASCSEVEKVMCGMCAYDYTMSDEEAANYYENMAFDFANDR